MPDDRDPKDELPPLSPWAVRPSLPHSLNDEDEVPATPDDTSAPRRSIFNRFRRGRTHAPELQSRLLLPDDEPAAVEPTVEEVPTDDLVPPSREPARSPWQRTEDSVPLAAVTSPAPPPPAPPDARPSPPLDTVVAASVHEAVEAPRPTPEPEDARPPAPAAEMVTPPALPSVLPSAPPPVVEAVSSPAAPPPAAPPVAVPTPAAPPPVAAPSPAPTVVRSLAPVPAPAPRVPEERPTAVLDEPEGTRESSMAWASLRPIPVPMNPYMVVLAVVVTLVTLAYLLVEPSPRWFLIMGAIAVAGGLDGVLRATWRVTYRDAETTPALFMPALFILAVPPLIEHNVRGLNVIPAGIAVGVAFFGIVAAQVGSARPGASYYPWARTISTAGAYAAAFAFFSLTYVYDLGVGASALACGLVALMLAIEVLREGEVDAAETAGYAAAAGAAVGQWRFALHYLPVDGYLAGLAVVLGFLVVTGLLQAYITRSLDRRTTIDHVVIATAGAALVIGARVAGLA